MQAPKPIEDTVIKYLRCVVHFKALSLEGASFLNLVFQRVGRSYKSADLPTELCRMPRADNGKCLSGLFLCLLTAYPPEAAQC